MNHKHYRIEHIEVTGIVQGVGFRPFVHNLALSHHLAGYVLNSPDGVTIEIEGKTEDIEHFIYNLENTAPPLSRIVEIKRKVLNSYDQNCVTYARYRGFEIRDSVHEGQPVTLIPPDACVCEDCLDELFDPQDRRYLYPFINCTNCGPRFTIIRDLPYDRPYTTMSEFIMCPDCLNEYENPEDRRFHAQPNACPVCGPCIELLDRDGHLMKGDPVVTAIELLKEGNILAVKGLGGFHLAVDGTNNEAVKLLRLRKHREEKHMALMVGSLNVAHRLLILSESEEQVLCGRERPILLAPRREVINIADAVAPDTDFLGIMLPYTPLHYELLYHPETGGDYFTGKPVFTALVMTSGNISEEPICRDNEEALKRLSGIADAFLVHNRNIHARCDDSVVRHVNGEISFMRRSRGYVPVPVFLKHSSPPVLALGGELKNTLCITEGRRAFTSQHIGDLENTVTLDFFHEVVVHFKNILEIEPHVFAYDPHPEYLSTKYYMQLESETKDENFGSAGIQHHHAHIASVLAEHGYDSPVIGFSLDGTGYGFDGTIWGGEVLLCTPYNFKRVAHLDYVPLPGGEAAIREPWRMAFAYLRAVYGDEWSQIDLPSLKQVSCRDLEVLDQACASGLNCPQTSSLGRLFDAVSSIIDICHVSTFEGQAAYKLDMLAGTEKTWRELPFAIQEKTSEPHDILPVLRGTIEEAEFPSAPDFPGQFVINYKPLIHALVEETLKGRSRSGLAMDFHITLLASLKDVADRIREISGINTVALSGGCWQNRILSERFPAMLRSNGYTVLTNRLVPPNDGGLSLGQAFVASRIAGAQHENV
ncbi:carbamoyltransferase HypF [Candidatus Latescibacterota bacterium]